MPKVTFLPANKSIEALPGSSLLEAAGAAGVKAETPCGGTGLCRKCLVRVKSGKAVPGGTLPEKLANEGYILLCRAKLGEEPLEILIPESTEKGKFTKAAEDLLLVDESLLPKSLSPLVQKTEISVSAPAPMDGLSDYDRLEKAFSPIGEMKLPLGVIKKLPETLREKNGNVSVVYSDEDKSITRITSEDSKYYGIAVDLGTTTVAVLLVDLETGEIIDSGTEYNAQISCGLDVISRINYARTPHRLEELRDKALSTINNITKKLAESSGIDINGICCASVAGNTVMTHLLLGIIPEYIRLDPYTPAVYSLPPVKAKETGLLINPESPVYIAPSVGSYMGGDITSGLLCTPLAADPEELNLFMDIGTNGEIVLGNKDFLIGCACSAGPAFEGGGIQKGMRASAGAIESVIVGDDGNIAELSVIGGGKPAGICGSGIISLIAELLRKGYLDPAGKLIRDKNCPYVKTEGRSASYYITDDVYITEADIENLIRAKAAVFSACRVLLSKVELDFGDLSKMYIAGGFGRYLNIKDARTIGLIPYLPDDRFVFLGNSSASGAYMTLISKEHRNRESDIAGKMTYMDLSIVPEYFDEYVSAMFLPHTDLKLFLK
jgi:uncharacterized 2Fe-2S/4Fe-4S cluster protein (DUF4445 family)